MALVVQYVGFFRYRPNIMIIELIIFFLIITIKYFDRAINTLTVSSNIFDSNKMVFLTAINVLLIFAYITGLLFIRTSILVYIVHIIIYVIRLLCAKPTTNVMICSLFNLLILYLNLHNNSDHQTLRQINIMMIGTLIAESAHYIKTTLTPVHSNRIVRTIISVVDMICTFIIFLAGFIVNGVVTFESIKLIKNTLLSFVIFVRYIASVITFCIKIENHTRGKYHPDYN
jgi:hypothetical protein